MPAFSATVKGWIQHMRKPRNIVGPVVRQMREKQGLTQAALAAKLNLGGWDISRDTLAKIEAQTRWVADFEVLALASALGVPVSEILASPDCGKPHQR